MIREPVQVHIILARKLDCPDHCHQFLSISDIIFAFVGSKNFRTFVDKKGEQSALFRGNRLYLKTNNGLYFSSTHRSLKNLCDQPLPGLFVYIQKSLVVNIQNAKMIDFREKQIGIGMKEGSLAWLTINRRYIKILRQRFVYSAEETIRDE